VYLPSLNSGTFATQMDAGTDRAQANACTIAPASARIGASDIADCGIAGAEFCIGEQITSILQLLKRVTYPYFSNRLFLTANWSFRPFAMGGFGAGAAPYVLTKSDLYGDYISLLAPMYAYNRGGVRCHFSSTDSVSKFEAYLYSNTNTSPVLVPDSLGINGFPYNGSRVQISLAGNNDINVAVPHYNRTHSRLCRVSNTNAAAQIEPVDDYSSEQRVLVSGSTTTNIASFGRQASDDYALGYFLGVPPIFISTT